MSLLSAVPGSDSVIAGVAIRGLWVNSEGTKWTALGTGAGSNRILNRASWIAYDPAHPGVFWESGIYNGGGVYRTDDNGTTFRQLGGVRHVDYVSVDFRDPQRQTLLAGGHEQAQLVNRSTDGGQTWTNIGLNLPTISGASTHPIVIDAGTYVVNAFAGGRGGGIYRTTDSGASWQRVSTFGPNGPPLLTSNGAIYWVLAGSLLQSTNAGVTWNRVGAGLRDIAPIELPDGRIAAVRNNSLVATADGGATWVEIGVPMPYTPTGFIYSSKRGAFLIWRSDCGDIVRPDAIMSLEASVAAPQPRPIGLIARPETNTVR
jgi:photosystem II stability/assembly factor-like uncharacterized protein